MLDQFCHMLEDGRSRETNERAAKMLVLETDRILLRRWRESDLKPFAALNSDVRVMEFFPSTMNFDQSKAMVDRIEAGFVRDQFGLWAAELKETHTFIGFVGLSRPTFEAQFTPCVEIGWRIACEFWGRGLAPEAASEVLRDGFERLNLSEIVSFTAVVNQKSIRVMEKLGMKYSAPDNFLHPALAESHPLKPHVLYKMSKTNWSADRARINAV
jgi:RimJ/RimL family protein N-acetyltransferase